MNTNNIDKSKGSREGKIKSNICYVLFGIITLCVIAYVILGYIVHKGDIDFEQRDGLNRLLDDVPSAMKWVLPQWAGFIWFLIDCFIILITVYFLDQLLIKAKKFRHGIKYIDY